MNGTKGKVFAVNGNMITVHFDGPVMMNEVAFIETDGRKLKSEVIRIKGNLCSLQVFEMTKGIKVNDDVEFSGDMLAVELGPGLLTQIYDGLQNPLPQLAKKCGYFLERGVYLDPLPKDKDWAFTPAVEQGAVVSCADTIGTVPELSFTHKIMVPFNLSSTYTVKSIMPAGHYTTKEVIAVLTDDAGEDYNIHLSFYWPIKRAITCYEERYRPNEPLVTQFRLIDTFFPVAKGGTYCVPGPFGAGKTVLQQTTSQNADVDIVVIAACGERAGEVVEVIHEFPKLTDPRTAKPLMERTVIICNTSSMPVASREASLYTAITISEYYRQMGLHVLLLADSTSRWAQALRETSGRLEEIPGEEAFPAYLESTIAGFYERAGLVRNRDGSIGSITVGGTVSPAGGNFEEPVTQATLKVVGAFHGLSRERSDAHKYPAIHPMDSWSKYKGIIPEEKVGYAMQLLIQGSDVEQMMKVVGEEGTSLEDYIRYLKSTFLDAVYLQQNSFDKVDKATSPERQKHVFNNILLILGSIFNFADKDAARIWFNRLRQKFIDYNYAPWQSDEFKAIESEILGMIKETSNGLDQIAEAHIAS
ncbi:MAG: V-type ATP synthase subunit A [Dehalococcoidia bacterium]|nr:V-type ATP synthase subunit A [Dehalococcoidia bacterium]